MQEEDSADSASIPAAVEEDLFSLEGEQEFVRRQSTSTEMTAGHRPHPSKELLENPPRSNLDRIIVDGFVLDTIIQTAASTTPEIQLKKDELGQIKTKGIDHRKEELLKQQEEILQRLEIVWNCERQGIANMENELTTMTKDDVLVEKAKEARIENEIEYSAVLYEASGSQSDKHTPTYGNM